MARKLWATQFVQVPGSEKRRHESKVMAYRYVDNDRANWQCGALRSPFVHVFVDERDGRGWKLYEKIDLSEGAPS
jgi:hypothetical protein